jgi:hypothetical protein
MKGHAGGEEFRENDQLGTAPSRLADESLRGRKILVDCTELGLHLNGCNTHDDLH